MKVRLATLFVLASALAAGWAGAAMTAQQPEAAAGAYGITLVVPGQPGAFVAAAGGPGAEPSSAADGFAYPADGSIVRSGALSSSVAVQGATPQAQAVNDVLSVALFNGEITFDSAAARAKATASADTAGSAVTNLVVFGQAVVATPNQRLALGDWGFLVTLEGGVEEGDADAVRRVRAAVTAVHVTLTAEHAGLPPGTEILIGHAEAETSAPIAQQTTTITKPTTTTPSKAKPAKPPRPRGKKLPRPPEPGQGRGDRPVVRPVPTDISAALSPGGYVFPVYGPSSFTDTYGAPRAAVTWHHGEDIFAPLGAPVVAVTHGTVFSVGWNDIGGYRFWLRDRQGNQFYYAHLSAFSPIAVDGRQVRAGDVIGFVGNTGDARTTPYHLHFEIHPVSLLPMGYDGVINPFQFLSAWRRLEDVTFAAGRGWAPPVPANATAPRPGAFLLGSADISRASGLEPGALERALAAPVTAGGDGALVGAG